MRASILLHSFLFPLYTLMVTTCNEALVVRADNSNNSSNTTPYSEPKNVYGEPLKSCSSSGMARTGYTRTGYCINENDDIGSHHICIDLSSTTGGNFCTVTGQPNWCSSKMTCHEDYHNNKNQCLIQNWCVCQWAFASYVELAGGCDHIQYIHCDAVNIHALIAYQNSSQKKYIDALNCLQKKCGLVGHTGTRISSE